MDSDRENGAVDLRAAKDAPALTGGDLRPCRALQSAQFLYRPTAIPIISFNRTPRIKNEDPGTRRRFVFIPLR